MLCRYYAYLQLRKYSNTFCFVCFSDVLFSFCSSMGVKPGTRTKADVSTAQHTLPPSQPRNGPNTGEILQHGDNTQLRLRQNGPHFADIFKCGLIILEFFFIPTAQWSCWGYIGFTPSVRLSVRPASRVHSVAPTVLVGSISYLYTVSRNLRRCVVCKIGCKISKFKFLAIFLNL